MARQKEILVCAATSKEMEACRSGIEASGKNDVSGFYLTGIGPWNARNTLGANLQIETSPDLIVSTGFAGAITDIPYLSWIDADRIFTEKEEIQGMDLRLLRDVTRCSIISLPRLFMQGEPIPSALSSVPGSLAVDMESAALAEIARQHQVPFIVLRMITDNPENPLPDALGTLSDMVSRPAGQSKIPYLARALYETINHPKETIKTIRDIRILTKQFQEGWTKYAPEIVQVV